jgi:hypothetical protein
VWRDSQRRARSRGRRHRSPRRAVRSFRDRPCALRRRRELASQRGEVSPAEPLRARPVGEDPQTLARRLCQLGAEAPGLGLAGDHRVEVVAMSSASRPMTGAQAAARISPRATSMSTCSSSPWREASSMKTRFEISFGLLGLGSNRQRAQSAADHEGVMLDELLASIDVSQDSRESANIAPDRGPVDEAPLRLQPAEDSPLQAAELLAIVEAQRRRSAVPRPPRWRDLHGAGAPRRPRRGRTRRRGRRWPRGSWRSSGAPEDRARAPRACRGRPGATTRAR